MAYTTINKSGDYFETKLYTGNDANDREISLGLTPDLTWIKARSAAYGHTLFDRIRGLGYSLSSSTTAANRNVGSEFSWSNSGCTTNSFTVDRGSNESLNENAKTMVAWNWKANGAGSANTDGSISSTVSANTTSGFSIVKWSGSGSNATIGHGLGVAPKMVITKSLGSSAWGVYNENLGNTNVLFLDTSAATSAHIAYWNNTSPTSSVFSVGSDAAVNHSGNDMIAYCFAEKQGYSKFGKYTGNGNADGPFIYTGFKPAFLIVKNIDAGEAWGMHDNKRPGLGNGNAPVGHFELYPNLSNVENSAGAAGQIDFLSNGFKLRTATNSLNVTQNYIYMAFASEPLVGDNPATAR